jgi:hypothetical protein
LIWQTKWAYDKEWGNPLLSLWLQKYPSARELLPRAALNIDRQNAQFLFEYFYTQSALFFPENY